MTWKRGKSMREKEEQQPRRAWKKTLARHIEMYAIIFLSFFFIRLISFSHRFLSQFGSRHSMPPIALRLYILCWFFHESKKRRKKTAFFPFVALVDSRHNQTLHGNVPKLAKIDGVNDVVWFIAIGRSFIHCSLCRVRALSHTHSSRHILCTNV